MFEDNDTPVRCADGHLFTTIWVPLVSFKALRLGARRFQYCPVGRHWTMVRRLESPTMAELQEASAKHDRRIP